jgi:tetratricopeptide (TPR) repeat protein
MDYSSFINLFTPDHIFFTLIGTLALIIFFFDYIIFLPYIFTIAKIYFLTEEPLLKNHLYIWVLVIYIIFVIFQDDTTRQFSKEEQKKYWKEKIFQLPIFLLGIWLYAIGIEYLFYLITDILIEVYSYNEIHLTIFLIKILGGLFSLIPVYIAHEFLNNCVFNKKFWINRFPNFSTYIIRFKALIYLKLGDFSPTYKIKEFFYSKAIDKCDNFFSALSKRAFLYNKGKLFELSIKDINILIELFPDNTDILRLQLINYILNKEYYFAESMVQRICLITPNAMELILMRALIKLFLKKYDEAIVDFSFYVEKNPGNLNAILLRVDSFIGKKEFENALNDIEKILQKDKKNASAHSKLGVIYSKKGDFKNAILEHNKALSLSIKPNASFLYDFSCMYALMNDIDNALKYFSEAINLNPDFKETAIDDEDFNNIRNNSGFKELLGLK